MGVCQWGSFDAAQDRLPVPFALSGVERSRRVGPFDSTQDRVACPLGLAYVGVFAHLGWFTTFLRLRYSPLRTNGGGAALRMRGGGRFAQDGRRGALRSGWAEGGCA